eukprot:gene5503-11091_t
MSRPPKKLALAIDANLVQDNLPAEVVPKLFIGSLHAAFNQEALVERGITHIVNASRLPASYPKSFTYLSIDIRDKDNANLLSCIPAANIFIEAGMESGGVLVHCCGGRSRSSAFVTAFLMSSRSLTVDQVYPIIRIARPVAAINGGFISQLKAYALAGYDVNSTSTSSSIAKTLAREMKSPRLPSLLPMSVSVGTNGNGTGNGQKRALCEGYLSGGGSGSCDRRNSGDSDVYETPMARSTSMSMSMDVNGATDNMSKDEDDGVEDNNNNGNDDIINAGPVASNKSKNKSSTAFSIETRAPNIRLSRPGSGSVRVIPPVRGLEQTYCCDWCATPLFCLANVLGLRADPLTTPLSIPLSMGGDGTILNRTSSPIFDKPFRNSNISTSNISLNKSHSGGSGGGGSVINWNDRSVRRGPESPHHGSSIHGNRLGTGMSGGGVMPPPSTRARGSKAFDFEDIEMSHSEPRDSISLSGGLGLSSGDELSVLSRRCSSLSNTKLKSLSFNVSTESSTTAIITDGDGDVIMRASSAGHESPSPRRDDANNGALSPSWHSAVAGRSNGGHFPSSTSSMHHTNSHNHNHSSSLVHTSVVSHLLDVNGGESASSSSSSPTVGRSPLPPVRCKSTPTPSTSQYQSQRNSGSFNAIDVLSSHDSIIINNTDTQSRDTVTITAPAVTVAFATVVLPPGGRSPVLDPVPSRSHHPLRNHTAPSLVVNNSAMASPVSRNGLLKMGSFSALTSGEESPRIPVPPGRYRDQVLATGSTHSYSNSPPSVVLQSAEKRRWLARFGLLKSEGDAKVTQLAQQDEDVSQNITGDSSYIHIEYLDWMGEEPLSSDADRGAVMCGNCKTVIGTWFWNPTPRQSHNGMLEAPVFRVSKHSVREVGISLDATPRQQTDSDGDGDALKSDTNDLRSSMALSLIAHEAAE